MSFSNTRAGVKAESYIESQRWDREDTSHVILTPVKKRAPRCPFPLDGGRSEPALSEA